MRARRRSGRSCSGRPQRTGVKVTLVANQPVRVPASPHVEFVQVSPGFDVADNEIVKKSPERRPRRHLRHPAGGRSDGERRPCAQPARRAPFHGDHPPEARHARLHGYDAGQRDTHRRTAGIERERAAVVCQPSGRDAGQVRERLSDPPSRAADTSAHASAAGPVKSDLTATEDGTVPIHYARLPVREGSK